MKGTILNVFGRHCFLRHDLSGKQFFAHASAFQHYDDIDRAVPGMLCEFSEGAPDGSPADQGRGRPQACRVQLLD
jgi:hypothetical protein